MKGVPGRALIFGISGQDGTLLAGRLLAEGFEVHGTSRQDLGAGLPYVDRVRLHCIDPTDRTAVADLLAAVQPAEIYNLSGQSSVGLSFGHPYDTFNSHLGSTLSILESIRASSLDCRFFNASSGEVFGDTGQLRATEQSALAPSSPYGAAKAAAHLAVKGYRDSFGLFACSAFLFNHESQLRPPTFVSRRIADGAAAIKLKRSEQLALGNLAVVRDWGWADDYVQGMTAMLRQSEPKDFVVATGVGASLESFVARIFARLDLDWRSHVVTDASLVRKNDIAVSVGNPSAIEAALGWRASLRMPEVADRLADEALARAR